VPESLHAAIANPAKEIYVSAVSVWEIAIKRASGKLAFTGSAAAAIPALGFLPPPITPDEAEAAGALPFAPSRSL
jgi:PIN domain nuclease of toxin-antitoxin system